MTVIFCGLKDGNFQFKIFETNFDYFFCLLYNYLIQNFIIAYDDVELSYAIR